ncbi:hypothetical protein RMSM_00915 [Rhodopirellula maiorica SM1]|uniref:Uncharacterized protein n=1 Tax=Rhodopirellula maiorica SM1 TaxID=1265738 RepID=M5S7K4_9BACT|nr:hypothetical protein RMSM_00915 [Rhodopirellula maiorica SM1]
MATSSGSKTSERAKRDIITPHKKAAGTGQPTDVQSFASPDQKSTPTE